MTFFTTPLAGDRVLVEGTDTAGREGQVVLDASQWLEIKARKAHDSAVKDYDRQVAEFFAPLNEAAEALDATHYKQVDPATVVIIDHGEDAVTGRPAQVLELHSHSIILRLIEEDQDERLVWVGDNLEVRAFDAVGFSGGPEDFGTDSQDEEPAADEPVSDGPDADVRTPGQDYRGE